MFLQPKTCRRKGIFLILLVAFPAFLLDLASATTSANPSPEPLDEATVNTTLQDLSHLYLAPETSCTGYDGQWNCLSDKFQHCAGGQWSAVLSCSGGGSGGYLDRADSMCSPLGRTDSVEFDGECNAAWGWGSGNGGGGRSGGGTSCNGNRCYYGAGERVVVEKWLYFAVVGVVVLRFR